jgi:DNA-binding transcriptional regulator YhcF (GntR family)
MQQRALEELVQTGMLQCIQSFGSYISAKDMLAAVLSAA